jgi:hypothetical protein
MTSSPTHEALLARLDALPPRLSALLERAVVEGISTSALAERRGVPLEALERTLWRAAQAFAGIPPGAETSACREQAHALAAALDSAQPLPAFAQPLESLRAQAEALRSLRAAREMAHARWDGWVRAGLAAALVAVAIWMSR